LEVLLLANNKITSFKLPDKEILGDLNGKLREFMKLKMLDLRKN
jgi:hypothetical protein